MCMVLVSNYEKIIYYRVVRRLFPFIPTHFVFKSLFAIS
jgi:hypothetical protein